MNVMIIPSTHKPTGEYYFSAPNSPSNLSQFYNADFDNGGFSTSAVPFGWEEKPGTPKSPVNNDDDVEFAFDVGELESERVSLSAEELFHGGVIKPLKPPPRLRLQPELTINEPAHKKTAPISLPPLLQTRKIIQGALSPRHKDRESADPFVIAAQNATKSAAGNHRGRERSLNLSKSSSRKTARSLSPLRVSEYLWEDNEDLQAPEIIRMSSSSSGCSKGHKKWRLKDFFLFRSASEGRAADKDKLKKYTAAFRHWSFRVTDSPGLGSGSIRNEPVSVREVNRSVSEDFKKKTFLPYKRGIVGALANGFGFSRN